MSFLTSLLQISVADDANPSSNPALRAVDWKRVVRDLAVGSTVSQRVSLAPGETRVIWDGSRTIGLDGTTQLSLTPSPLDPSRYRLAWTGTGASPAFRTDRAFIGASATLVMTVQANATLVLTSSAGAPNYAGVQVGDTLLLPGVETGDPSGPFDVTPTPGIKNTGRWTVLSKTGSSLTLARPSGQAFVGVSQSVAVTLAAQAQAFSSPPPGVQPGDTLELLAGFAAGSLRTYLVLAVAPGSVDLQSTLPVPAETLIPGVGGVKAYTDAKNIVFLETDQAVVVQVNGDTSTAFGVTCPLVTGASPTVQPGWRTWTGATWRLAVLNRSQTQASVFVVGVAG